MNTDGHGSAFICVHLWFHFVRFRADENSFLLRLRDCDSEPQIRKHQWELPLPEVACERFHCERGYGALTRARRENGAQPNLAQSLGYFFKLEVLTPRDPVLRCGLCGVEHGHRKN